MNDAINDILNKVKQQFFKDHQNLYIIKPKAEITYKIIVDQLEKIKDCDFHQDVEKILKYKIKSTTIFNKTNRFQFQNSICSELLI